MTLPPENSGGNPPGAERVLAEALKVMAGGDRGPGLGNPPGSAASREPLQLIHVILLAAIVGMLAGVIAGLVLA